MKNMRPLIAELIATFALVFIGIGSIVADKITNGAVGLTGIAFAHGLTVVVMVGAIASVSGGHLNPAVTVALWVARKMTLSNAISYIVFQCMGAILAVGLLTLCVPRELMQSINFGTPSVNIAAGISMSNALVTEILLTFLLVFVVFMTAVHSEGSNLAPIFIGLTITADIFIGGPISGAAINPARYLGPALLGGGLGQAWLYWVGPLLGGILAAAIYKLSFEKNIA